LLVLPLIVVSSAPDSKLVVSKRVIETLAADGTLTETDFLREVCDPSLAKRVVSLDTGPRVRVKVIVCARGVVNPLAHRRGFDDTKTHVDFRSIGAGTIRPCSLIAIGTVTFT
jgi:hypothetical protein